MQRSGGTVIFLFPSIVYSGRRMERDIDRVLISQQQIAARVKELAAMIIRDHTPPAVSGEAEITIVPVLTGAMMCCADLIRQMPVAMKVGLMTVSSYPGNATRSRGSQVLGAPPAEVCGRHVVVVDDILDSGGTVRLVAPLLQSMGAASVRVCVLLRKDRAAAKTAPADYVGFEIPDEFVVGYGLDYNDYYRNLPDIVTLKREAIDRR
jgi:hypoxanthine phosphoribosyltransferase